MVAKAPRRRWWAVFLPRSPLVATPWTVALRLVTWVARWSAGSVLYWWGEDGWQLGSVARVSSQASFSHVVAYHRGSSALSGTAHSLLDAASYGSTWVALSPLPPAGVSRTRARPPSPPAPTLSLAGGP